MINIKNPIPKIPNIDDSAIKNNNTIDINPPFPILPYSTKRFGCFAFFDVIQK